jgi:hypothetical protein
VLVQKEPTLLEENSENAYANFVNSINSEQTSYDDLLDALRLSLKGYNIK